jgi:hypothetical protein
MPRSTIMKSQRDIGKIVDDAFSCYDSTVSLVRDFLNRRSNSQEIILLVCARLDSLANSAFTDGPQKQKFTKFLLNYSTCRKLFASVSVGDLYFYLKYHFWVLPGTIDQPGRLHAFSPDDDLEYMNMVWKSGLPITRQEIGRLLKFLLRNLSANFRVVVNQSQKGSSSAEAARLMRLLADVSRTYRRGAYAKAVENLKPVVEKFCLGNILYKEYRCGVIHEYQVAIDSANFFSRNAPYWHPFYNSYVQTGGFLRAQFPGTFLLHALVDALSNFKKALKGKGKLPACIFNEICNPLSETDYLDVDTLSEGKSGKISF